MDKLRIARIKGFDVPIGTSVTFQGQKVGHVIGTTREGICECAINSDLVKSWIDEGKASISIDIRRKEVVRND